MLDITWTFWHGTSSKTTDYEMHQSEVQNIKFILESSKLYIAVGQMSNTVITHKVDPGCMCKNWGLLGKYRAVRILSACTH